VVAASDFDRVVLINLRRRSDRLRFFREQVEIHGWPFKEPDIFPAIDGTIVPTPTGWEAGAGAWGCMQSHRRCLEDAIADNVQCILMLEDDICMRSGFLEDVARFLSAVPSDWEQLMFGGQHIYPPTPVSPGVVRCMNCQRTHAYAIRGQFLRDLYSAWCSPRAKHHCDWIMGPLQTNRKVYAPDPFIFGQSQGRSEISGSNNPTKFWVPCSHIVPVIFLDAPLNVMNALRDRGCHPGYWHNHNDIDVGLDKVYSSGKLIGLAAWIEEIAWEVSQDERLRAVLLWHPSATIKDVRENTERQVCEIVAESVEDAFRQLEDCGIMPR
jgi:hypothetical protein